MDKKVKDGVIVSLLLFFSLLAVLSMFAGADIGADLGEYIYNIKH